MSSPSTNPSSCDSSGAFHQPLPSCSAEPSVNQQYTNSLDCSSPALAQAVPGNDPSLPEQSTGPKILLTTAMANQAAEDLLQGKAKNVIEWYELYKQRMAEEERQRNQQNNNPNLSGNIRSVSIKEENSLQSEQKPLKRKMEDEPGSSNVKSAKTEIEEEPLVYQTIGEPKETINPLRKMEMMANSSVFQPSTKISEVVAENQPKRDRAGKSTPESEPSAENTVPPIIPICSTVQPIPPATSFPSPNPAGQIPPFPYPYPGMVGPGMFPPGPMPPVPPGYRFPPMPPGALPHPMMHPGMRVHPQYHQQMQMWQMHQQRMMAARTQCGQMSPMPYPGGMPPYSGFPPMAPGPPGPLSGPLPQLPGGKMPSGPMTAPSLGMPQVPAPFPSMMCSPFPVPPGQNSPMTMPRPDSHPSQPTPLFSFSMGSPQMQPSPMLQDISNKPF